jgi:WD40 repeat protein
MLVLEGPKTTIYTLAFSPDGLSLASGAKDGSLLVYDPAGQTVPIVKPHPELAPVSAVSYHPQGHCVLFGHRAGWSSRLVNGFENVGITGPSYYKQSGDGLSIAFLDSATFVVGTGERIRPFPGTCEVWDFDRQMRREPRFHEPNGVRAVATHPPSRLVAWANGSRRVTVWDITKTDPIHFNQPHTSSSVSFHPDGNLLAAASDRGFVIYDVAKRMERFSVRGHTGRVSGIAFSPDGQTLATASWDETVRLWDVGSGQETACFRWSIGKVFCLAYAPDGLRMAAGGDRGTIVVWDVG